MKTTINFTSQSTGFPVHKMFYIEEIRSNFLSENKYYTGKYIKFKVRIANEAKPFIHLINTLSNKKTFKIQEKTFCVESKKHPLDKWNRVTAIDIASHRMNAKAYEYMTKCYQTIQNVLDQNSLLFFKTVEKYRDKTEKQLDYLENIIDKRF